MGRFGWFRVLGTTPISPLEFKWHRKARLTYEMTINLAWIYGHFVPWSDRSNQLSDRSTKRSVRSKYKFHFILSCLKTRNE